MDEHNERRVLSTPRDQLVGALADDLAAEAFMFARSLALRPESARRAAPARRDDLFARAQRIEAMARGVLELDASVNASNARELWRRVEVMYAQLRALDGESTRPSRGRACTAEASGSWTLT